MNDIITAKKRELINELWATDPQIYKILMQSKDIEEARSLFFEYLNGSG